MILFSITVTSLDVNILSFQYYNVCQMYQPNTVKALEESCLPITYLAPFSCLGSNCFGIGQLSSCHAVVQFLVSAMF